MTVWSSLNAGEIGTLQDLRDSCDSGYFLQKQSFSGSPKAVQKDEVNAYVYFTAFSGYNAKSANQLIAKEDIGAYGGGPQPATPTPTPTPTQTLTLPTLYYLVQQSSCADNGTTTTATLGDQVSAPTVGQYVTLNNSGGGYPGCWRVTSIGTGYGATVIIANYGGDCTCAVTPTTPTIVLGGTLTGPTVCAGVAGAPQTFTVSGTNLVANVVVTPPGGYEVSTYNGGYASSVSLSPSAGTLSTTTIYIRLKSNANNGDGGNITVTSTNAVTQTKSTGTATVNVLPTVTSVTNGSRSGTGTVTLYAAASSGATIDWYDGSNNLLASGTTSFTTPSISVTTTYYVRARNTTTGCVSSGTSSVTATINAPTVVLRSAIIDAQFFYAAGVRHYYTLRFEVPIPFLPPFYDVTPSSTSSDRHAPTSSTSATTSYIIAGTGYSINGGAQYARFGINLELIRNTYTVSGNYIFSLYGYRYSSEPSFEVIWKAYTGTLADQASYNNIDFTTTSPINDPYTGGATASQITTYGAYERVGYFTWDGGTSFTYTDL